MADDTTVHIGENSPEQIAFKLLQLVGLAEKKSLNTPGTSADRDWILKTYAQCLRTVQAPHSLG